MKGNAEVLKALNEALSEELTAINQYFLHAEMCESWGYGKLSAFIKQESIDEMKHAEVLIERILFLEGTPNMTDYRKLNIGKSVPKMIANDLKLEASAVEMYNKLIRIAVKENDNGTAELLKQILKDEEGHIDQLEEQEQLMKDMGLENYLAMQFGGAAK
jgi:bacterioferritin